jgi:aminoglycoside phosphotransferase family enzyme/predicted kinase
MDDQGKYSIDAGSEVVDVAIRMKRLPDEVRLDVLLETGGVTAEATSRIAHVLAEFHANAERASRENSYEFIDAIRSQVEANFDALLNSDATSSWELQLLDIAAFSRAFLKANEMLMVKRAHDGFVRDCHGDIHAGNVFLADQIRIIDRIEFNSAFREIDVASDVGFLAMDVARLAGMEVADHLIEEFVARSGDAGCRYLLPFFAVYRAMVRAKVAVLRLGQTSLSQSERSDYIAELSSYFNVALAFMDRLRPRFLLLMCGLSGTGKSTVARELAQSWRASRISSDRVREQMVHDCEAQSAEPLPIAQRYGDEMTEWVYQEAFAHADRSLEYRSRVILDATFSKRSHRYAALLMGRKHSAPVWLLQCKAGDDTMTQRLDDRTVGEADGSEATSAILEKQAQRFEDVRPDDADHVFSIETGGSLFDTVASAHRHLWATALTARHRHTRSGALIS